MEKSQNVAADVQSAESEAGRLQIGRHKNSIEQEEGVGNRE
jgi:hypothetical protein